MSNFSLSYNFTPKVLQIFSGLMLMLSIEKSVCHHFLTRGKKTLPEIYQGLLACNSHSNQSIAILVILTRCDLKFSIFSSLL